MLYLVYKTTNLVNGKYYIGCHKTETRDDGYLGSGKFLKRAIEKYGIENFTKEILFEASSSQEMFDKEKELVVLGPMSYNVKQGGEGGWDHWNKNDSRHIEAVKRGYQASKESMINPEKNRQSALRCLERKKGLFDPKYDESKRSRCLVHAEEWRGKHHTEESKRKIGAGNKGKVPWNKGKPQSEETKEKIRQNMLKRNAGLV